MFAGNDAERTVSITPTNGETGTTTITLTVSDGSLTASDTFVLTVEPDQQASQASAQVLGADVNEIASLAASGEVEVEDGSLNVSDDLLLSGNGTLSLALNDQDLAISKVTVGGDSRLDADATVVIEAADDLAAGSYQLFAVDGNVELDPSQVILPDNIAATYENQMLYVGSDSGNNILALTSLDPFVSSVQSDFTQAGLINLGDSDDASAILPT